MAKYRLKAGTDSFEGRVYQWNDPANNIRESDQNLAALDPARWDRIWDESEYAYNPDANRPSPRPEAKAEPDYKPYEKPGDPAAKASPKAPAKDALAEKYGDLEEHTVADLKEIAEAEDVKLPAGAAKADIVKALKAKK